MSSSPPNLNHGALLIHKESGISSFGIIEALRKTISQHWNVPIRKLPKMGHGGTLDPFATGLLVILIGNGVKLAQYFLGSSKTYTGVLHFGESTIPGDPTAPIHQTSSKLPSSLEEIQNAATHFTEEDYWQIPPMHSAKKYRGKKLYEIARKGGEVERKPKLCRIFSLNFLEYNSPDVRFEVQCSSGTYIRTLAQDLAIRLGTVGMLMELSRTASGNFQLKDAMTLTEVEKALESNPSLSEMSGWVPFDALLSGYPKTEITEEEKQAILNGKQNVLFNIIPRTGREFFRLEPGEDTKNAYLVLTHQSKLVAVSRFENQAWRLERVFSAS